MSTVEDRRPVRFADAPSSTFLTLSPLGPDLSPILAPPGVDRPDRDRWIAFAPADALVHPHLLAMLRLHAVERPDVDIFYGDDVALGAEGGEDLYLKPAFDPEMLVSQAYIGAPLIVRAQAFDRLGGLDTAAGPAALYDLLLRALGDGLVIERISEVLIAHPGARPRLGAEHRRALEAWLEKRGGGTTVLDGLAPASLRQRRAFAPYPEVTLLIPTCQSRADDGRPFLAAMLDSLAKSRWPADRFSVLVGDDLDDDAIYRDGGWPFAVRRILTPRPPGQPFNYAAKMNRLWREASTEHVVMMNDDLTVLADDWLEALMTFAVEEDIGGVGARLLYADGTVQHAGMAGGLFGVFAHPWALQPADKPSYQDWALVQRDWSAVTGAVFATRRSVLEAVDGFDERFALEYNDVDLCLRMRTLGYRIAYAPDAAFTHHERASRAGRPPQGSQTALFLRRWAGYIDHDPAYHPQLVRDSFAVAPAPGRRWWRELG